MNRRIVLLLLVILSATVSNDGTHIRQGRGSSSNKASRRLADDDDGGNTDDATSKPTHKPTSAPLDDDEDDDDDDDFVPTHKPTIFSTPSSRPTSAPSISFMPTPISMNPSYTHAPTPSALLPTGKTFSPTHHPIGPSVRPTKHPTFSPAGKSTGTDDDAAADDGAEDAEDDEEDVTQAEDDDDTGAAGTTSSGGSNFFKSSTFYIILSVCLAAGSCVVVIVLYFCCFRAKGLGSDDNGRFMKYVKGSEYLSEETSLLSDGLNGPREASAYPSSSHGVRSMAFSSNMNSAAVAPPPFVASPPSSRIYFRASDLEGQVDNFSGLLSRFTAILSAGLQCNLHTTKGPKPILLSMIGFEVRWQAVKSAQKRYKLHLRDVMAVEVGKRTSNFQKSRSADDSLCYSLVTQKTTLDLEATSKIERDSLVKGFQICLINLKNSN